MPSASPAHHSGHARSLRTRKAGRTSRPIVLVRRRLRSDAEAGRRLHEPQPLSEVPYAQRYYGERV
jgi:hypothetical protein